MLLNHVNLLMSCGRQIICQYLVVFALSIVISKFTTKMTWSELGTFFHKKAGIVAVVMLVAYVVSPLKMTAFVGNVISILAFVTLMLLIIGSKFGERIANFSATIGGGAEFWLEVLKNPIRLGCFAITIWYFAKGSILDAVVVFVFLCVGTKLLVEKFGVDTIDWSNPTSQNIATVVAILLSITSLVVLLGVAGIIGKIIFGVLAVVAFLIGAFVIVVIAKKLSEK